MVMASAVVAASTAAATAGVGLLPAIYAGIGAIVGGLIAGIASFAATIVQQRAQDRRDLVRMAVDLGSAEYAHDLELARGRPGGANVAPLASYVIIEHQMLKILNKKGEVTPEEISAINREKILAAFPGYPGPRDDGEGEREDG
jgi:hypothetical protein